MLCSGHLVTPLCIAGHLPHLYQATVQAGHVLQAQLPRGGGQAGQAGQVIESLLLEFNNTRESKCWLYL